jgi:hypothetical protein
MSKAVLETMLPAKEGMVHSADLDDGIATTYFTFFKA